jgi:hopanoid biosynthesis associated protein HpnK
MKRLIVNADDLGESETITGGILRAHREGIVTSTTLLVNLPGAEDALDRVRHEAPALAVGVHLNLTMGRPVSAPGDAAPLLDGQGRFRGRLLRLLLRASLSRAVRSAIEREFDAQVGWAIQRGLKPTHLDGHKHVHEHPAILPLTIAAAKRHGVRAIRTTVELRLRDLSRRLPPEWGVGLRLAQRLRGRTARRWGVRAQRTVRREGLATTDWFFGVRATGGLSADLLKRLLGTAPDGTGELMVHPGLAEAAGGPPSRLTKSRPRELKILCDPRLRRAALALGWGLTTFAEVGHE